MLATATYARVCSRMLTYASNCLAGIKYVIDCGAVKQKVFNAESGVSIGTIVLVKQVN